MTRAAQRDCGEPTVLRKREAVIRKMLHLASEGTCSLGRVVRQHYALSLRNLLIEEHYKALAQKRA